MTAYVPHASKDGIDTGGSLSNALTQLRGHDGQLYYATDAAVKQLLVWDYSMRSWMPAGNHCVYQAYASSGAVPRFLADDFRGSTIDSRYSVQGGGGTAAVAPTITAGAAAGLCTLVTGTANGATACSSLATATAGWVPNQTQAWQGGIAAKQLLVMTGKLKMTAITSCSFFFGFSDVLPTTAATAQTPLYFSGATTLAISDVNTGVSNCVGFLFDTSATLKQVQLVNSLAGAVGTPVDTSLLGTAITANTYLLYRLTVDTAGNAVGYMAPIPTAGTPPVWVKVGSIALAVAPAAALAPNVSVSYRSATLQTLTLDAWCAC